WIRKEICLEDEEFNTCKCSKYKEDIKYISVLLGLLIVCLIISNTFFFIRNRRLTNTIQYLTLDQDQPPENISATPSANIENEENSTAAKAMVTRDDVSLLQ
ncbi:hypothetical protein QYM36_015573, partial [Artemia franciscana]